MHLPPASGGVPRLGVGLVWVAPAPDPVSIRRSLFPGRHFRPDPLCALHRLFADFFHTASRFEWGGAVIERGG